MQFVSSKTKNIINYYNNKSILITGASGFIGSHLTKKLIEADAKVTILVRYTSEIRNIRLSNLWQKVEIIEGDIRNHDSLVQLKSKRFNIIFHLAAYNHVGQSFLHVSEVFDVNAKGTANLIDACEGYSRFVYTSTSEVYGKQEHVPFIETMDPHPISPYAVTKYSGELYCRMKSQMDKLPIVIIRPFNTFGPYQSSKAIIPELIIKSIKGKPIETTKGKQTREFNYVDNIVDGFLRCGIVRNIEGEVINVAEGFEISIFDLVQTIHKLTRSLSELRVGAIPYRPTEIWRMVAGAKKAKELLGWKSNTPFIKGLKMTIEWYRRFIAEFDNPKSDLNQL
jgi:UDP-glucose 4-epimerase